MFLPQLVLNTIQSEKITHICIVSSKLDNIVRNSHIFSKYNINSLKVIMTGAEVVKEETIKRVLLQNTNLSIINGYGPTEATCVCIAFSITSEIKACNGSYPIGQPLKNVEVKFLSDSGDINDACGEILINSSQLFIGYLNKLSITQNSFIERAGKKYYKTGDMGMVDGNKQINFIGRKDDLIKFRGYRVEKQEICNAIFKIFPMAEAYVYCTEDDPYKQNLVVAISDSDFNQSDEHQLIQNLKMVLPSYMVPSRIVCFDTFPKLNSGKIDKKNLERNIILKI
jgi:acyl-CoA synthetase (AMP-forming)/AMP-acid ligase II